MTSTVFLIRHGAHDRLGRRLCGRADPIEINAAGTAQADAAARWLAGRDVTRLATSPVARAQSTAARIGDALGLEASLTPALTEIDFADWAGRRFDALAGDPAWQRWNDDRGRVGVPGGEAMIEVQARVARWLDGWRAAAVTIAAVSHADVIKAAVAHVSGLPLACHDRIEIAPGSITTLVVGEWGGKLVAMNEVPRG